MGNQHTAAHGARRAGQIAGLLLVSALLAFFLLSSARAQETLVRIEIDAAVEPVPVGEEFEARVLVEDVEHMASFSFTIEYDPDRIEPVEEDTAQDGAIDDDTVDDGTSAVRVLDIGEVLTTSERREGIICGRPAAQDTNDDGVPETVAVSCVTTGPPLCLDGLPGVSGSGLLGRVVFRAKSGGTTTLKLTKSTLVLDDIEGCDLENRSAEEIPHSRGEDVSVRLEGGGGISGAVIGIIIGVVVVVVAGVGLGGFLWYQRRAGTP